MKASELTPYQYDALVKHYFLKQGVKPSEVDEMDANLVDDLMILRQIENDKDQFRAMEEKNKIKLKEWMRGINNDRRDSKGKNNI